MYKPPDTALWWKNRRRMAYASMSGLFILIGTGGLAPADQIAAALPLFQTIAYVFGAVILFYVTAATIEDVVKLNNWKQP
jgi:hypothetical protein